MHNYLWENREETFLFNEARVLVTVSEKAAPAEGEEANEESKVANNESSRLSTHPPESAEQTLLVGFAPNPTDGTAAIEPRYFCRIREFGVEGEAQSCLLNSFLGGKAFSFEWGARAEGERALRRFGI